MVHLVFMKTNGELFQTEFSVTDGFFLIASSYFFEENRKIITFEIFLYKVLQDVLVV